jgi:hypothetical protein
MGWLDFYTPGDPGLFEPDGTFETSFSYNGGTYSEVIIDNLYITTGVHNLNFQLLPRSTHGKYWIICPLFPGTLQ